MEIVISEQAQKHIEYWKNSKNIKIQERIVNLKNAIIATPYQGIGNPDHLSINYRVNGLEELIK